MAAPGRPTDTSSGPRTWERLMNEVTIVEVSPRDGLQNEGRSCSTDAKVELITRLVDAGVAPDRGRLASCTPRLVPQMADAEAVMERRAAGATDVSYAGLILNARGLDRRRRRRRGRGQRRRVRHRHLQRPQPERHGGRGDADGGGRRRRRARDRRAVRPRSPSRRAFGCPFEGEVDPARVAEFAAPVRRRRARTSSCLADTIGVGGAGQVTDADRAVRDRSATPCRCAFHFHNTRNTGFANAYAAVDEGVDVLDASAGGIGGCPFAPDATGNIATDDLVYMLERMGRRTGIDLKTLIPTAGFLGEQLGHEVPALLPRAGLFLTRVRA